MQLPQTVVIFKFMENRRLKHLIVGILKNIPMIQYHFYLKISYLLHFSLLLVPIHILATVLSTLILNFKIPILL